MRRLTKVAAVLLTAALCLSSCGDDDDLSVDLGPGESTDAAQPPLTTPDTEPSGLPLPSGEGEAPCEAMFAEGRATEAVVADYDAAPCTIDGEVVVSLLAAQECADGRTLHFNELGWGYAGEGWQRPAPDQPSPPDGLLTDCLGTG